MGSLLEVGTGFHPELTGRENIFLNGAIIGMPKAEIRHKFDEIVDFAEIESFICTPIKRYSSGMYLRLAFAVAAFLEPEILLVDEVLAVGDAAFQKKCLGKMEDISKEGRTVLFVSHNIAAIRNLCQKAIILNHGEKIYEGEANNASREYLRQFISGNTNKPSFIPMSHLNWINVESVELFNKHGTITEKFFWPDTIYIQIDWKIIKYFDSFRISLYVTNQDAIQVFSSKRSFSGMSPKRYRTVVELPGRLLNDSSYNLDLHIDRPFIETLIRIEPVARFSVLSERIEGDIFNERHSGIIKPDLYWNTKPQDPNSL